MVWQEIIVLSQIKSAELSFHRFLNLTELNHSTTKKFYKITALSFSKPDWAEIFFFKSFSEKISLVFFPSARNLIHFPSLVRQHSGQTCFKMSREKKAKNAEDNSCCPTVPSADDGNDDDDVEKK